MEVKSLNGKIESKAQNQTKKGKDYWKFKINDQTFNWFDHEAGQGFNVGEEVNITFEENEVGDRTYKNIKSMGKGYSSMSDQALSDTHKEVEREMGGGSPQPKVCKTDYNEGARRQTLIIRQSSLNYATQIETAFLIWKLNESKETTDLDALMEKAKKNIKKTAKEYEEWVERE